MRRVAIMLGILVAGCGCGFALNPSLDISQYAHTAWTVRDGFSLGNIYAIAQTPDGYLWLGTEFGLFRFDGVRSLPWQPPAGQHLPDSHIQPARHARRHSLDWHLRRPCKLERRQADPAPGAWMDRFVASLLEDREGTVWAGTAGQAPVAGSAQSEAVARSATGRMAPSA